MPGYDRDRRLERGESLQREIEAALRLYGFESVEELQATMQGLRGGGEEPSAEISDEEIDRLIAQNPDLSDEEILKLLEGRQ